MTRLTAHLVELELLSGNLDRVRRCKHSASKEDVLDEVSGVAGDGVVLPSTQNSSDEPRQQDTAVKWLI